MPVKSLTSSVLRWPERNAVRAALKAWAREMHRTHPGVLRVGVFGSFNRPDWGVGSDLDLVAVVRDATLPFERRAAGWDTTPLPVPADLLVYTEAEWRRLMAGGGRFARTLRHEMQWLHP